MTNVSTAERPNACNLCHLDQTLAWSANHLADWYGLPTVELDQEEKEIAASLLWLLRGDAPQRAIAAWHVGWEGAHQASGTNWQAPFLAQLLDDPYAVVRYVAHRALQRLPQFDDFEYDFIGSKQSQTAAKQRAVELWRQYRELSSEQDRERLLLTAAGELQQEKLDWLRILRDDTPVRIPE